LNAPYNTDICYQLHLRRVEECTYVSEFCMCFLQSSQFGPHYVPFQAQSLSPQCHASSWPCRPRTTSSMHMEVRRINLSTGRPSAPLYQDLVSCPVAGKINKLASDRFNNIDGSVTTLGLSGVLLKVPSSSSPTTTPAAFYWWG